MRVSLTEEKNRNIHDKVHKIQLFHVQNHETPATWNKNSQTFLYNALIASYL